MPFLQNATAQSTAYWSISSHAANSSTKCKTGKHTHVVSARDSFWLSWLWWGVKFTLPQRPGCSEIDPLFASGTIKQLVNSDLQQVPRDAVSWRQCFCQMARTTFVLSGRLLLTICGFMYLFRQVVLKGTELDGHGFKIALKEALKEIKIICCIFNLVGNVMSSKVKM